VSDPLTNRRVIGYAAGVLIFALGAPFCLLPPASGLSWWLGPFVGCISLGLILWTAQMSSYVMERVAVAGFVALVSAFLLYTMISEETKNRGEYQTLIPFLIGLALAVPLVIWPVRRVAAGWKRMIARSIVLTLVLAPLPFGPEGTLMPLIVTLVFPPLIFLFMFPGRILLSFLFCLSVLSAVAGIQTLLPATRVAVERRSL
jgi:hypothetical protein